MIKIINKGFTFIELLVGALVMAVALAGLVSTIRGLSTQAERVITMTATDRMISNVVEKIVKDLPRIQVNFTGSDPLWAPSRYQLYWDRDKITAMTECPNCKGKIGVNVAQHPSIPSMAVIVLKIHHPELFKNPRIMKFLASF